MSLLSNNNKVVLYLDNMLEHDSITREQCIPVEYYDFELARSRNVYGEAYGLAKDSMLHFTVTVGTRYDRKSIFQRMTNDFSTALSLIFNVEYDEQGNVQQGGYDGAMVLNGYFVDVQEEYLRSETGKNDECVTLRCQYLLSDMTVVGEKKNLSVQF